MRVGEQAVATHQQCSFFTWHFRPIVLLTKYSWNITNIATRLQTAVCSAMLCICLYNLIRFLCRSVDNLFGSALFVGLKVN
jgi:hypothetical protein